MVDVARRFLQTDQPPVVVVAGVLAGDGRSAEHAADAALYFGFEVTDEFGVGALPGVFFGIVTP